MHIATSHLIFSDACTPLLLHKKNNHSMEDMIRNYVSIEAWTPLIPTEKASIIVAGTAASNPKRRRTIYMYMIQNQTPPSPNQWFLQVVCRGVGSSAVVTTFPTTCISVINDLKPANSDLKPVISHIMLDNSYVSHIFFVVIWWAGARHTHTPTPHHNPKHHPPFFLKPTWYYILVVLVGEESY